MAEKESMTYNLFLDSVADPGSNIPIRIFSIPDPESASKNLSIFTPKIVF
jgi:hypothetical protein